MHPSAHAHMALCIETYLPKDRHYDVLDFGSATSGKQQTTHRELFSAYDCQITGADIRKNRNVDVVMRKPYRLPLPKDSFDVVVTGQVFEHIPFFWVSFLEIARVLRSGGHLLMTVPSRGHTHTVQDCWRFYPDGMRALAAFAAMELREAYTDFPPQNGKQHDYAAIDSDRYYWGDTVAVFRKPDDYPEARIRKLRKQLVRWGNQVGGLDVVPPAPAVEGRERILG